MCGYALSESPYGMIWPRGTRPYGTLGSPRQHPTLGHVNDARVVRDGRRSRPARSASSSCATRRSCTATTTCPTRPSACCSTTAGCAPATSCTTNDDGTYTFVGRKKEVIRRRGENLSPAEVEEALESHPDVAEAAVVGVPSELSEEEVKAFVVLAGGRPTSPPCASTRPQRLTRFKVPRYIEAVDELPHTPTGRVAKHELPRDRTARRDGLRGRRGERMSDGLAAHEHRRPPTPTRSP